MKTKHRHNLKENDLARLIGATREWAEPRGKQITAAIVSLVVVAGVVIGVLSWRSQAQNRGQDLLAAAMVVLNTAVVPVTSTTTPGEAPAAASITAKGTRGAEAERRAAEAAGRGQRVSGHAGGHHRALSPGVDAGGARQAEGSDSAVRRGRQACRTRQSLRADGAAR